MLVLNYHCHDCDKRYAYSHDDIYMCATVKDALIHITTLMDENDIYFGSDLSDFIQDILDGNVNKGEMTQQELVEWVETKSNSENDDDYKELKTFMKNYYLTTLAQEYENCGDGSFEFICECSIHEFKLLEVTIPTNEEPVHQIGSTFGHTYDC